MQRTLVPCVLQVCENPIERRSGTTARNVNEMKESEMKKIIIAISNAKRGPTAINLRFKNIPHFIRLINLRSNKNQLFHLLCLFVSSLGNWHTEHRRFNAMCNCAHIFKSLPRTSSSSSGVSVGSARAAHRTDRLQKWTQTICSALEFSFPNFLFTFSTANVANSGDNVESETAAQAHMCYILFV